MKLRIGALALGWLLAMPLLANEHEFGISYQYDRPDDTDVEPSGYGLRYQYLFGQNWLWQITYADIDDEEIGETEGARVETQYYSLGSSYITDTYYLDLQLSYSDDQQGAVQRQPLRRAQIKGETWGLLMGGGRFHDWRDWSFEYGAAVVAASAELDAVEQIFIPGSPTTVRASSTVDTANLNLGGKASYYYYLDRFAVVPSLSLNWLTRLWEDETQNELLGRFGSRTLNLIRRGYRYPGFLTEDNIGFVELGLDLFHEQGFGGSLYLSRSVSSDQPTTSLFAEISYRL